MKKIYFATKNKYKLKEARELLTDIEIEPISLETNEIQEIEVDSVIKHKALSLYRKVRKPLIVEDTGLYFNALNGFPGALVKWVMTSIGTEGSLTEGSKNDNIIKLLSEYSDKSAYAKTSIALCNSDRSIDDVIIVSGIIEGRVSEKAIGCNGFGWDDFFIPSGHTITFAQMSSEEKNKISMRKKALLELKKFLL